MLKEGEAQDVFESIQNLTCVSKCTLHPEISYTVCLQNCLKAPRNNFMLTAISPKSHSQQMTAGKYMIHCKNTNAWALESNQTAGDLQQLTATTRYVKSTGMFTEGRHSLTVKYVHIVTVLPNVSSYTGGTFQDK